MRPFAGGTKVRFAGVEAEFRVEHRLTNTDPNIIGLVLALGHEGLLGRDERRARREEERAAHRVRTHALRRELSSRQ